MNRLLACAGLMVLCGCVSDIESSKTEAGEADGPTGVTKSAVINGIAPISPLWTSYVESLSQSVVEIYAWDPTINDYQLCTGTQITPTWVLTAAHCIHPDWDDSVAVYGRESLPGDYVWSSEAFFHPQFEFPFDPDDPSVDIALLRLEEPVTTGVAKGWDGWTIYYGEDVYCYGYGVYSENNTGAYILRWAQLRVDETTGGNGDSRRYTMDRSAAPPGGRILGHGDSGGPCFDMWTGYQTGVTSTTQYTVASPHYAVSAEQQKFSYVKQWVIDTITNN